MTLTHHDGPDTDRPRGRSSARGNGRRSGTWGTTVRGALLAALVLGTIGGSTVRAEGEDVCPEPNDQVQAACHLGTRSDALGFISNPDDVDAYRLVTRDYGTRVSLTLPDSPHPYRLSLIGYDGEVLRRSDSGALDAVVSLPGTYYALVDSVTGESDDILPYRISLGIRYPWGLAPVTLYEDQFGRGTEQYAEHPSVSGNGTYGLGEGYYFAKLQIPSTPAAPTAINLPLEYTNDDPLPTFDDFTYVIDTQLAEPVDAGYIVTFRRIDNDNYLRLDVSFKDQQAILSKKVNGQFVDLTRWTSVSAIRPDGVNRTIIRCVGSEIQASINGKVFATLQDDTFRSGLLGYGAQTWGAPAKISFDNILVTTPIAP